MISLFAERDDSFDLLVASNVGVVDDSTEVVLKSHSSLFDQLWVLVGFCPEVSNWEERHLVLS